MAWRRLGSKLVVVELAMAMVLLSGAGLFGKSLYRLLHVPLGLQPEHLVMIDVSAPDASYGKPEQSLPLVERVMRRAEALPGVTSVGLVGNGAPVSGGNGNTNWLRVLGRPLARGALRRAASNREHELFRDDRGERGAGPAVSGER